MTNFLKQSSQNQDYLTQKINPLIEKLYRDLLLDKPVEPVF